MRISERIAFVKSHPHCKLPGQIGGAARPSGLMSVDLAGRLVSSTLKTLFSTPCRCFQFFLAAIFVTLSPLITIAGLSNSILRRVNSQKCLMKIQYREFKRPVMIAMRGGLKIAAKKIELTFSIFSV